VKKTRLVVVAHVKHTLTVLRWLLTKPLSTEPTVYHPLVFILYHVFPKSLFFHCLPITTENIINAHRVFDLDQFFTHFAQPM